MPKMMMKSWCDTYPGERPPRFLTPFLLLLIWQKESHGYELLDQLQKLGLTYGEQEAGYIYRKLRTLEASGLIVSEWDTQGLGAAKRVYTITEKGIEALDKWSESLEKIKISLEVFLALYKKQIKESKKGGKKSETYEAKKTP